MAKRKTQAPQLFSHRFSQEIRRVKSEHDLRLLVKDCFFYSYKVSVEDERVDFLVTQENAGPFAEPCMWAESKDKPTDIYVMFAQLLLTIKKKIDAGELPPKFLGVFDREKIAFTEYHHSLDIFNLNDFDWTERPSSVSKKTVNQVRKHLKNVVRFDFLCDAKELADFIDGNFVLGGDGTAKAQINKNNFVTIYMKWWTEVRPSIALGMPEWAELKRLGVGDCDFYLADLLSKDNVTISGKLRIILQTSFYESKIKSKKILKDYYEKIYFEDGGERHRAFWAKYERPPKEEYHQNILERRDLLVPQRVREERGAYFTPQIWVAKSQEYLEKVFGEDWQEEYYVWDCCAGTCNLLAGLTNKYNVWASTLDEPDVYIVHRDIADNEFNLLEKHVFQFDFLNDDFSDLPQGLQDIINDPVKRKKLIIYINPPYGEGDKRVGRGRSGIAESKIQQKYSEQLGYTKREKFVQFLARIYFEIPGCKIAEFSTFKAVCGTKFGDFRRFFKAKCKKSFAVPANTFDNVNGNYPIAFKIWDTAKKEAVRPVVADMFDKHGNFVTRKMFRVYEEGTKFINDWADTFDQSSSESLGNIIGVATDFQHQRTVCIEQPNKPWNHQYQWQITSENLIESAIYFAVRHCIKATWINDRDQFLFPRDGYKKDEEFQSDCLIFTLFHNQNYICSPKPGSTNPWIPFTAREVDAKDNFRSTFVSDVLKKRKNSVSNTANDVLKYGKALWKYYHQTIKLDDKAIVNASLYEIREYFKGRNEKGRLKAKSTDEKFNVLEAALRSGMKELALKIQPKVYEYGFLLQ